MNNPFHANVKRIIPSKRITRWSVSKRTFLCNRPQVGVFFALIPKIYTLPLLLRKGEFHPPFLPSVCRVVIKKIVFSLKKPISLYSFIMQHLIKSGQDVCKKMQVGGFLALIPKILYTLPLFIYQSFLLYNRFGYSDTVWSYPDTFSPSQHCHCKRGGLYSLRNGIFWIFFLDAARPIE